MNKLDAGRSNVFILLAMAACTIGMFFGCGEDNSTLYQTEDISADMHVTSRSDNSRVAARFQ